MQPLAVVEDLDVIGDSEPRAGPAGEGLPVVHLVLQGGEERFGGGVVPAHAGPAEAGAHAVGLAEPGELAGGVLAALVAVEHRSRCEVAVADGYRPAVG